MKVQKQSFASVLQNKDSSTFRKFYWETPVLEFICKKSCMTLAASENNEQQQLSEGFADSCYKIVSPILLQELINDFAVCKRCSGRLNF